MSLTEKRLWSVLRRDQLGHRFRRHFPIGPCVLDFYCPERRLCIEVDDPDHDARFGRDRDRDAYLSGHGIRTLRIPVHSLNGPESLLDWAETIQRLLEE